MIDAGGERIELSISSERMLFESHAQGVRAAVSLHAQQLPAANFGITCSEPSRETFLTKHFARLVKAAQIKSADIILLQLEANKPLAASIDCPPFGAIAFYLAPLIVPDED